MIVHVDAVRVASQHGAVSDVLQISDRSISVQFFQVGSIAESIRDELRNELESMVSLEVSKSGATPSHAKKVFDKNTPAYEVEQVIAERIRPGVNSDGGDVELVELTDDGVAIVRLKGACNGCPSSDATLKHAIEKTLLHFCSDYVKSVRQEDPSIQPHLDSIGEVASNVDLPSVITHNHTGSPLDTPLSTVSFPVVSLFARKVDKKMLDRVRFTSSVYIPNNSGAAIDVWVKCVDCGMKKRLEDVNQLISDAKQRAEAVDRVGVVICPACAVVVTEKPKGQ